MAKKLIALILSVLLVMSLTVPAYAVQTPVADTAASARTVNVGVINYLTDELGATGWQVHYWNSSTAGDADLTSTGKTEQKDVGYWDSAQTFSMFTASIPADATGFKVHKGDRWFGNDGTVGKMAYVFNYSGDKALYVDDVQPTEAPTQEPTEAPTQAPLSFPYSFNVDLTAVTDAAAGSYWYAWTWGDGVQGQWRPIEKFGYVAAYEKVLFANFSTDDPGWDNNNLVAQTVDFTVEDGGKLTILNEKENDKFKGVWKQEETTAPTTEPSEATAETITVYFTDALNWGEAKVYYWPNGGEFPGTAMTK